MRGGGWFGLNVRSVKLERYEKIKLICYFKANIKFIITIFDPTGSKVI